MSSKQNSSDTVQFINEESTIEDRLNELEVDEIFKKISGQPYSEERVRAQFDALEDIE